MPPTLIATKESANEFILLPDLEIAELGGDVASVTAADVAAVDGDEILQNIIRSNERLAKELAKMPPLPKLSSYKKPRSRPQDATASATATTSAIEATLAATRPKCFCPSFMRHSHSMRRRSSSGSNGSEACCRSRNASRQQQPAAAGTSGSKARTQTTHSKSMLCHGHEFTLDTHHHHHHQHSTHRTGNIAAEQQQQQQQQLPHRHSECCHPYKTDPLPWLQQHLVLNQTISSGSATNCQPTCQAQNLTVNTESMAAAAEAAQAAAKSTCRGPGSNALSASIKPKLYFEQLLQRDGCHKKPRPPVKVDVNVRLVPKQPKVTRSLNETFVQEVDAVAHALNETFVKETDNDNAPELAHIDEQLAELEQDRQRDRDEEAEEEEQEQTTNLEKQQLRATNEQLMSRLRQIWAKYKSQLPVHQGSLEPSFEDMQGDDEHLMKTLS
ncbi:uncharacterized protein Dana_GF26994, partial [Drosophila ananassae]